MKKIQTFRILISLEKQIRNFIGSGNRSRAGLVVLIGVGVPFLNILVLEKIFWVQPFQLTMLLV